MVAYTNMIAYMNMMRAILGFQRSFLVVVHSLQPRLHAWRGVCASRVVPCRRNVGPGWSESHCPPFRVCYDDRHGSLCLQLSS